MRSLRITFIVFILSSFFFPLESGFTKDMTDEAQKLYQQYQDSVFQIRVIDLSTGKKNSVGSGFQISPEGHIATNYHVVSNMIVSPGRYRLEYVAHDGSSGDLKILDVDVIHDLAIAKTENLKKTFLDFSGSALEKGERTFSMGNPHDLGMTIIEGIYNGLMEQSLYKKILFSGSLNPGMSGGPALDRDGHVIGVNASTQGNEISFLVPIDYLKILYDRVGADEQKPITDWHKYIEKQLVENQNEYMNSLLSASWDQAPIGNAFVPGEISKVFKCWSDSKDDKDLLYEWASLTCSSQDDLYLSPDLLTGNVTYKFAWLNSKGLNPFRFYHLYESWFASVEEFSNAGQEDITNFKCHTSFVDSTEDRWKVVLCARQYKKYPNLYDINFNVAAVNYMQKGLMAELDMLGISQGKATAFIRKFMSEIKWQK